MNQYEDMTIEELLSDFKEQYDSCEKSFKYYEKKLEKLKQIIKKLEE